MKINNKFNLNLMNQYENESLYNEELFDFVLANTDINELKNNQFSIGYHNNITVMGNIEAYLTKGIKYDSEIKTQMYNKIQEKYSKELLKPLYFIQLHTKEYIVESAGYLIFENINYYLKDLGNNKVAKLTDTEEKFVIDWFFKETPVINLSKSNSAEINELFTIFSNQKEYFNKRNDKSIINNFFEHAGMKKMFNLFTDEQKNSLMNEKLNHEEVLKSYYSKLLKQKHFDLAEQIKEFDNKDIVSYLHKNVSEKPEDWFKAFLVKGSGLSFENLNNKINGIAFYQSDRESKRDSSALSGAIDLLKKLHNNLPNENVVKLIFASIIEAKNERLYKELRTFIELPQDEKFQKYLNQQKIYKKSIDFLEKEMLHDRLEAKLDNDKPKTKQNKI